MSGHEPALSVLAHSYRVLLHRNTELEAALREIAAMEGAEGLSDAKFVEAVLRIVRAALAPPRPEVDA